MPPHEAAQAVTLGAWWQAGEIAAREAATAEVAARAALVNMLGHEMTHLIPDPAHPAQSRFRDWGQSMPWCKGDLLISYGLGGIY